jgi:hypothetical protein
MRAIKASTDAALPALARILALGLAAVVPAFGIGDAAPVCDPDERRGEVRLRAHKPGRHATVESHTANHHVAVLIYAKHPKDEAELYEALEDQGLTGGPGVRVPRLLARQPDQRLLAVEWLDGPVLSDVIARGDGRRAGELAARWLERASSLRLTMGKPFGAERMMHRADKCAASLAAADPDLGASAKQLIGLLEKSAPAEGARRLVHGAFHDRNIVDLGDGPGVIDWHQFGQGPAELEAGMFLASISRTALKPERAGEAARAEEAFLERTAHLLEPRALAWHRAAAILWRTRRMLTHRRGDWGERAHALLAQATRHAERGDARTGVS